MNVKMAISIIVRKAGFYFATLHLRILRLIRHILFLLKLTFQPKEVNVHYSYKNRWLTWMMELPFYFLDIFAIPELMEIILQVIHPKNRPLTQNEKSLICEVYGKSLNLSVISFDGYEALMKKYAIAFVGFNTIFFNRERSDDILMHEACHCLQYQKLGSVYIIRALMAQKSREGYNYGGSDYLHEWNMHGDIRKLNYEQMAEIIGHYHIIKHRHIRSDDKVRKHKLEIYDEAAAHILNGIKNQGSISSFFRLRI